MVDKWLDGWIDGLMVALSCFEIRGCACGIRDSGFGFEVRVLGSRVGFQGHGSVGKNSEFRVHDSGSSGPEEVACCRLHSHLGVALSGFMVWV